MLALGLSGGGDSTALLHALRIAAPYIPLHALIVDHRLRPDSAAEADRTRAAAAAAGAIPHVLVWDAPRRSQARARLARHRLLADACRRVGAPVLCLAHTREDRVETLRMRAARSGPADRLAGPGPLDPSPVWPEGRGLLIARPLLDFARADLRVYLRVIGARWIEDPSNSDLRYERVRLRADPIAAEAEAALIAASDAAARARDAAGRAAFAVIERAARIEDWGGARLDRAVLAAAHSDAARLALVALAAGLSGAPDGPSPAQARTLLDAVLARRPAALAGVALSASGVLGRDPGACAGRADGSAGAPPLHLAPGESGVFDGRFECDGPAIVEPFGDRPARLAPDGLPCLFRPASPWDGLSGAPLASHRVRLLAAVRIAARLLPPSGPAWFDGVADAARAAVALAKPSTRPNIPE